MSDELNLFQRFMFEAPGDEDTSNVPPDEAPNTSGPDVPDDTGIDDGPPDISDDSPDTSTDMDDDGGPPDLGDEGYDDFSAGDDDQSFEDDNNGEEGVSDNLGEKISAIMNVTLYQTFLSLIGDINEQLTMIKNNTDMFYTLSNESLEIVPELKKLDENIRLYLKNTFTYERYEKNLLFFNKCMNLFKLLGDKFNTIISKGIKEYK